MLFYLPLEHSEDIEPYNKLDASLKEYEKDIEQMGGLEGSRKLLDSFKEAEAMHRKLLEVLEASSQEFHHGSGNHKRRAGFLKDGDSTFGLTC